MPPQSLAGQAKKPSLITCRSLKCRRKLLLEANSLLHRRQNLLSLPTTTNDDK